jgi:hypothetical protein
VLVLRRNLKQVDASARAGVRWRRLIVAFAAVAARVHTPREEARAVHFGVLQQVSQPACRVVAHAPLRPEGQELGDLVALVRPCVHA